MSTDLFGGEVYTLPAQTPRKAQGSLFDPSQGWMTVAEDYARMNDQRIDCWCMDRTFRVVGLCGIGHWYAVERGENGELEVMPL